MNIETDLVRIISAIECRRFDESSEARFQDGIAVAFDEEGIAFEREVRIAIGSVVDFMVGEVAVECKCAGSLSEVTRQLHRYALIPRLSGIVLATTRIQLARVPRIMNGKPILVAATLGGFW